MGATAFARAILGIAALSAALAGAPSAHAQTSPPVRAIVQSGHSLTDGVIDPLRMMIRATAGATVTLDKATIPGSPLDWRWRNPTRPDIRRPEIIAGYDTLVLTERAPLSNTMAFHDSEDWTLRWCNHAWTHGALGPATRCVLYGTWVKTISGPAYANPHKDPEGHIPFRDRLPLEQARWEAIRAHVNAERPAGTPAMVLIPGPRIMAAAHDAIAAGQAPGLTGIEALFKDEIHLNALGNYLIALAHYAVIFEADPRGLPQGVPARGGPDAEQAAWMQDLVWTVLQQMPGG